jgi:hypothetical protein
MSKRYWEEETPIVVDTGENILRFFENARQLQVCNPDWLKDGVMRQGKTVALDIDAVLASEEGASLFRTIFS